MTQKADSATRHHVIEERIGYAYDHTDEEWAVDSCRRCLREDRDRYKAALEEIALETKWYSSFHGGLEVGSPAPSPMARIALEALSGNSREASDG